jgi:hypothetical protein
MKKNKNVIIVSCLLTLFGDATQVFASNRNRDNLSDSAIDASIVRGDTSCLPSAFLKKFRLGDCCNGSNIHIGSLDLALTPGLPGAIVEKNIPGLYASLTGDVPDGRKIVLLQVGKGIHCCSELFEWLIIFGPDGRVLNNLHHGYRSIFGDGVSPNRSAIYLIKDDSIILQKLLDSIDLGEGLKRGEVVFFVYHRACNSVTKLYYDCPDGIVEDINIQRAWMFKFSNTAKLSTFWGLSIMLKHMFGVVPILSTVVGPLFGMAACYFGGVTLFGFYKLFFPKNRWSIVELME